MKFQIKTYKYHLLLIVAGLAWIAVLNALFLVKDQGVIYPDSSSYRDAAHYLYHGFKAHHYRPFGMAAIFGIPYFFGGTDAAVFSFSFVVNLLCWLGTALLLFGFVRHYLPVRKAFLSALLFFSLLGPAFLNFHLLTESIFTFLVLLAFVLIRKYYENKVFRYLSMALGILLFVVLIKPGAKLLAVGLSVLFCVTLFRNYYKPAAAFIYIGLGLIVFQCVKVKQEYGNFTLSYIDSVTYYNYLGSKANAFATNRPPREVMSERSDYIFGLPYSRMKEVGADDFKEQLSGNTANLIKAYFSNIIHNATFPSDCIAICRNLNDRAYFEPLRTLFFRLSKLQNILFSAIGLALAVLFCLRSWKKPDVFTLISLYILYIIGTSGISYAQGDRFHVVFFPFVIILLARLYAGRGQKITLHQ